MDGISGSFWLVVLRVLFSRKTGLLEDLPVSLSMSDPLLVWADLVELIQEASLKHLVENGLDL